MNNYPSLMSGWNTANRRHAEICDAVASERTANRAFAEQVSKPPVLGLPSVRGFVGRILIDAGNRIAGVATPASTPQPTSAAKS